MTETPNAHPCFTARAIDWLQRHDMAEADPNPLALWLQDAWLEHKHASVLVSNTGRLHLAAVNARYATASTADFF